MLQMLAAQGEGRRRRPKIIGKVEAKWELKGEKSPGRRLHVRAIIRDGSRAFVGSQSLRKLELEKRREVGVIVDDREGRAPDAPPSSSEDWARRRPERRRRGRRRRRKKRVEKPQSVAAAA